MVMKMVGVAELKAKLSEYLDSVKAGEEVVVTERGKPVARLSRPDPVSGEVEELVKSGVARPPRKKLPTDFFTSVRPEDPDGSILESLIDERREGR